MSSPRVRPDKPGSHTSSSRTPAKLVALAGLFGLGTILMWWGLVIAMLTAAFFDVSAVQVGLVLFVLGALLALLERRFILVGGATPR